MSFSFFLPSSKSPTYRTALFHKIFHCISQKPLTSKISILTCFSVHIIKFSCFYILLLFCVCQNSVLQENLLHLENLHVISWNEELLIIWSITLIFSIRTVKYFAPVVPCLISVELYMWNAISSQSGSWYFNLDFFCLSSCCSRTCLGQLVPNY